MALDHTTKRFDGCSKALQITGTDVRRHLALETVERCSHSGRRTASGARELDEEGTAIVAVDLSPNESAPFQTVDDVRQRRALRAEPLVKSADGRLPVTGEPREHMRLTLRDPKLADHRIEKRTDEMRRPLRTGSYTHLVLPYFVARIVYGLPTVEMRARYAGEAVSLGGCLRRAQPAARLPAPAQTLRAAPPRSAPPPCSGIGERA
ncbi:MAG TPA: hypothetical protein VKR23_02270 [Gaiellaceae bacterium]|nr:hypothetical protein [Gaiellaceae bacterium]